jgi:hypothetical protein
MQIAVFGPPLLTGSALTVLAATIGFEGEHSLEDANG